MGSDSVKRFVELVIATTIGSIVGAYIARDIQLSLNLFMRALFATCLLAIFFFFVWQFSTHIGKRRKARHYAERYEEPERGAEELAGEEPEPYEDYAEGEEGLEENFEEPEEKQQL
ncbi:MAG: hypothetical protein J7L44_00605 [Candidatus Diapherotrites archaeon]|nr:hypothetical protein [Candidatus Diapherotrites archaeon]